MRTVAASLLLADDGVRRKRPGDALSQPALDRSVSGRGEIESVGLRLHGARGDAL